jgi:hypothetical protein
MNSFIITNTSIEAIVQRTKQASLWYSGPSCLSFTATSIGTPVLLTKQTANHEVCNSWGHHCELPAPNSTYSPGGAGLSNNPRHPEATTGHHAVYLHSLGGGALRHLGIIVSVAAYAIVAPIHPWVNPEAQGRAPAVNDAGIARQLNSAQQDTLGKKIC